MQQAEILPLGLSVSSALLSWHEHVLHVLDEGSLDEGLQYSELQLCDDNNLVQLWI